MRLFRACSSVMSENRCSTAALASASAPAGPASNRLAISGIAALTLGESFPIHITKARSRSAVVAVGNVRRIADTISLVGTPAFVRRFISLTMSAGSVAINAASPRAVPPRPFGLDVLADPALDLREAHFGLAAGGQS